MLVCDVMTKEVVFVSKATSIEDVAHLLISERIHGVPVIEDGKPIGIVTETDFFTKGSMNIYLPGYISFLKKDTPLGRISSDQKEKITQFLSTTAEDIMSSPCLTINENSDLEIFLAMIREKKLITVPVVDNQQNLVGIITLADIINLVNIAI